MIKNIKILNNLNQRLDKYLKLKYSSLTQGFISLAPIDGLTVGADYLDYDGVVNSTTQSPESGSYYATYAAGPLSIGYSKNFAAFAINAYSGDLTESVEGTKYSVAFNVNDNLSISYENEESNPDNQTQSTANYTLEAEGIQAAYTMGGMTLAIAQNEFTNSQYTNGLNVKDTVFSVAMAF